LAGIKIEISPAGHHFANSRPFLARRKFLAAASLPRVDLPTPHLSLGLIIVRPVRLEDIAVDGVSFPPAFLDPAIQLVLAQLPLGQ
jgi:hypothetical protein